VSETDEPRFVLFDLDRSYIAASIADPDRWNLQGEEREQSLRLQAAVRALPEEGLRYVAANHVAVGGSCDLEGIHYMMSEPDQGLRDIVRQMTTPAAMVTIAEAARLAEAEFGLGEEEVATVLDEIEAAVITRKGGGEQEARYPVQQLSRAQLLDLFDGFGYGELWQDASDEELHRACLLENAIIREGDDTSSDAFVALEAYLAEVNPEVKPKLDGFDSPADSPAATVGGPSDLEH
jgi:hypothetical protein